MILRRGFFARPCLEVAEDLIGKWLVHGELSGRIVETEAYIGVEDQACHARFGETQRARILFGPPGRAYVFLIYGMYDCFNVVAEAKGRPAAVLIRAVEPGPEVSGLRGLRGRTDGPGKLCRALGITRAHNDRDLTRGDLHLEDRDSPRGHIVTTPRIGVDYAGEWAARPWRFVDAESRYLSKKLRR